MIERIHETMRRAVGEGVFPGAVLWVSVRGSTVVHESFGRASLRPDAVPATRDTVYDLASLTKAIVATTCIAILTGRSRLSLDRPVAKIIPAFRGPGKETITLAQVLNHASGLPAWRPLFEGIDPSEVGTTAGKSRILESVCREPLVYPAGTKSVYSDIGFILLGHLLEIFTGVSLDDLARQWICEALGMKDTFFLPLGSESRTREIGRRLIASTEDCPWRGKVLHGVVHDENAYAMGGVAGHAGLFGTAGDVGRFALTLLDALEGRSDFIPAETLRVFTARSDRTPGSSWALGWDTPSPPSSSGRYFSPDAFGHLGYTGTSLWIDPEKKLIVVLLSNRVHPTSRNDKIKAFRPLIHDQIVEELGLC